MMEIENLDKSNLQILASYFASNNFFCKKLANTFNGDIENYNVGDNNSKFIIRNYSIMISAIIIDCQNDNIEAITFYGLLDITYNCLTELFGKSRKIFVPYDNGEHIFFNENKHKGEYIIKILIDETEKKRNSWESEKLGNISILF